MNTLKKIIAGPLMLWAAIAHADVEVTPATVQAFDQVFRELDSPDKPAVAVALFKKNQLIYQKAFGSSNLEFKVAATVDTKFQIDTLAWEFIAYATLMLESQGKLALNDDIRKYLPELPEFADKVTINHLLSSTDGVYGYKVLKALAGWEPLGADQQQNVMALIKRQKDLNFRPGTMFSPGSDTRLILLAKMVESISGQTFDAFCKAKIFDPLGMSNTVFLSDGGTLLANTATPYRDVGKGVYKMDYGSRSVPGPVNLYTSIRDFSTWRSAILSPKGSMTSPASKLGLPIKLDNGDIIKDISSISIYGQQHAGKERGIPKIYQLGNHGGYASSIFRFPQQDITVMVLSSGLAYNGSYAMRTASILLKDDFTEAETIDYSKIKSVPLSTGQLQKFAGNYWSPTRALAARVYVRDGALYYSRLEGSERALIPLGASLFQMKIDGDDEYHIQFKGKAMHFSMAGSDPVIFEPYTAVSYTPAELAQFSGIFYSEEINATFVVDASSGALNAQSLQVGKVILKPVKADVFYGDKSFMAGITFDRDKRKQIVGFHVTVDEVRHLKFKKLR